MTDKATHTPLPWKLGGKGRTHHVAGRESGVIFELGDYAILPPLGNAGPVAIAAGLANAAFIVHAVNSHHDLIEALREARGNLVRALSSAMDVGEDFASRMPSVTSIDAILTKEAGHG